MKLEDPLLPGLPDLGSDCFLLLMKCAGVEVKVLLEVRGDVLRDQLYMALDLYDGLLRKKRPKCVFDVDLHRDIDLGVETSWLEGATIRGYCRNQDRGDSGDETEACGK